MKKIILIVGASLVFFKSMKAQICSDPTNVIYSLMFTGTDIGQIKPITISGSSASVGSAINTVPTAPNDPSGSVNALGYNQTNGRFYYFNRNAAGSGIAFQFISYDPTSSSYAFLSNPSGVGTTLLRGAINASGTAYYGMDLNGNLYYYDISADTWTTIIADQTLYNFTSSPTPAVPTNVFSNYSSGDMAFDGSGRLWIIPSLGSNYGIYRINTPLPTSAITAPSVLNVDVLTSTTSTPGGVSITGICFTPAGTTYLVEGTTTGHLYRLNTDLTTSDLGLVGSTVNRNGDLTSCAFPSSVLPINILEFNATKINNNDIELEWRVGDNGNKYIVEHSTNGVEWTSLSEIIHRPSISYYSYIHNNISYPTNYYRIKCIDINFNTYYTSTRVVKTQNQSNISIWPNIVDANVNISTNNAKSYRYSITDMNSRTIISETTSNSSISLYQLTTGTYIIHIITEEGIVKTQIIYKK